MNGTVKQIEYANDIKATYMRKIDAHVETFRIRVERHGDFTPAIIAIAETLRSDLKAAVDSYAAPVVIDNRARLLAIADKFEMVVVTKYKAAA